MTTKKGSISNIVIAINKMSENLGDEISLRRFVKAVQDAVVSGEISSGIGLDLIARNSHTGLGEARLNIAVSPKIKARSVDHDVQARALASVTSHMTGKPRTANTVSAHSIQSIERFLYGPGEGSGEEK